MKIGLIVTVINSDHVTGVERYALELIRHIPPEIRENITLFCSLDGYELVKRTAGDSLRVLRSPFRNRILTDQLWLPMIVRKLNLDFVYNATLSHPWLGLGSVPFGIMVHDATPWRYADTISRGMRLYYRPQLTRALKSSRLRGVVTNSKSSQRDLVDFCRIQKEIIHPIHLAVNRQDFVLNEPTQDVGRIMPNVRKPYILTVGTVEPRKNLQRAIHAFSAISEEFPEMMFLIVGRQGWQQGLEIPAGLRERILFTGYVLQEHLPILYRDAELFVFPSIYEGFGFPLLEAMMCGAPIVASNASSLPEIGGEACVFVDPLSTEAIAEGMRKVLEDTELQARLALAGHRQLSKFSWKETMDLTWNLILQLTGA